MDPYFKKSISYKYQGHNFVFDVPNEIFSTFDIDNGTQLLIRSLKLNYFPKSILDIGCGYGVLGIVLAKIFDLEKLAMADKDMLALRYCKYNLEKNGVEAEVIPGVGLENVPSQQFDLIVSNIPAKIGDEAIENDFILKPLEYLKPKSEYWFVVVSGLNRLVPGLGVKHDLSLKEVVKRNHYSVYRLQRSA